MLTERQQQEYIDEKFPFVALMCRSRQWDGFSERKVHEWLNNFLDVSGKYFGLKILCCSLYYSEDDITALLRYGLFEKILSDEVKREAIEEGTLLSSPSILSSNLKLKQDKTIFIPLLDTDRPHESGPKISRCLVQKIGIPPAQSFFHDQLNEANVKGIQRLVIVDDCIGTGEQLSGFWTSEKLKVLRELLKANRISCYYLTLIAYQAAMNELRNSVPDLKIIACEELSEKHRVFKAGSIFWDSQEELDEAMRYFSDLNKKRGIGMYGYKGLDFAVIMHDTVPNWCLPIFWLETPDWKPLLKRKISDG